MGVGAGLDGMLTMCVVVIVKKEREEEVKFRNLLCEVDSAKLSSSVNNFSHTRCPPEIV